MYQKQKRVENRDLLDTFHKKRCVVCNRLGCDPCHIKSKGSGGNDTEWNVMPLCREHHTEQHKIGWIKMMHNYASVAFYLESHGWEILNDRLFRDANSPLSK